jgi:hypothetical protein
VVKVDSMNEDIEYQKRAMYDELLDTSKCLQRKKENLPIEIKEFIRLYNKHGYDGFDIKALRILHEILGIRDCILSRSLIKGDAGYKTVSDAQKLIDSILALNIPLKRLEEIYDNCMSIPLPKTEVSSKLPNVHYEDAFSALFKSGDDTTTRIKH